MSFWCCWHNFLSENKKVWASCILNIKKTLKNIKKNNIKKNYKKQSATNNNSEKIWPHLARKKNITVIARVDKSKYLLWSCNCHCVLALVKGSRKLKINKILFVRSTGDSDEVHGQPHSADEWDPEWDKDPQVLCLGEGLPGAGLGPPEKGAEGPEEVSDPLFHLYCILQLLVIPGRNSRLRALAR